MSRYIDASVLLRALAEMWYDSPISVTGISVSELIDKQPSIDIVRCQDCKYWVYNFNGCARNPCTEPWYATDFCNYGEREGE